MYVEADRIEAEGVEAGEELVHRCLHPGGAAERPARAGQAGSLLEQEVVGEEVGLDLPLVDEAVALADLLDVLRPDQDVR